MGEFVLVEDPYFRHWRQSIGDKLYYRSGGYTYKDPSTKVLEVVEREDWDDLDQSKSSLAIPEDEAVTGWLARSGKFHGCQAKHHDHYARIVLGKTVAQMEKEGWCRVYGPPEVYPSFVCLYRLGLSAEQRNWLSRRGYNLGTYE